MDFKIIPINTKILLTEGIQSLNDINSIYSNLELNSKIRVQDIMLNCSNFKNFGKTIEFIKPLADNDDNVKVNEFLALAFFIRDEKTLYSQIVSLFSKEEETLYSQFTHKYNLENILYEPKLKQTHLTHNTFNMLDLEIIKQHIKSNKNNYNSITYLSLAKSLELHKMNKEMVNKFLTLVKYEVENNIVNYRQLIPFYEHNKNLLSDEDKSYYVHKIRNDKETQQNILPFIKCDYNVLLNPNFNDKKSNNHIIRHLVKNINKKPVFYYYLNIINHCNYTDKISIFDFFNAKEFEKTNKEVPKNFFGLINKNHPNIFNVKIEFEDFCDFLSRADSMKSNKLLYEFFSIFLEANKEHLEYVSVADKITFIKKNVEKDLPSSDLKNLIDCLNLPINDKVIVSEHPKDKRNDMTVLDHMLKLQSQFKNKKDYQIIFDNFILSSSLDKSKNTKRIKI